VSSAQQKSGFEKVFTVTDYYDGPRGGIANFNGKPHLYNCIFGEQDYSNLYWLTPVNQEVFLFALEDWAIWKRWERAFYAGEVNRDSHPALPAERDRHLHIQSLLDEQLKTDKERCIIRAGAFANAGTEAATQGILVELVVSWSEPNGNSDSIWAD
jgi:hypothetical protein